MGPVVLAFVLLANVSGVARVRPPVPRTVANDNRTAAGVLRGGVLSLRLEARLGAWHPNADNDPAAIVPACAEEGHAPRIPGPLSRVSAGTLRRIIR